mmetsp:Transcript_1443/g.1303  ORF Transcript_1443/g.1303 Transcript_1443/m.1303 type:complete len:237 (+) Transcript_1443:393-1103(+)
MDIGSQKHLFEEENFDISDLAFDSHEKRLQDRANKRKKHELTMSYGYDMTQFNKANKMQNYENGNKYDQYGKSYQNTDFMTSLAGSQNEFGYSPQHSQDFGNRTSGTQPNLSVKHLRDNSGVDLFNQVLKNPEQKETAKSRGADPKVAEFFTKINMKGLSSLKSNLLYTTTKDKVSGRKFHEKCDKKHPIIILITLKTGYMFGAFTYKSLDPKHIDVTDDACGFYSTNDGKSIEYY